MDAAELKSMRKKFKVSLIELAAKTGLPESYLVQIEEGQIQPLEHDLNRILKALWALGSDLDKLGPDADPP